MSTLEIVALVVMCLTGMVAYIVYDRWRSEYGLRRAHQKVERLRQDEEAGIPPNSTDYHYAIAFDSEAVTVSDLRNRDNPPVSIRWTEISRATVFKCDQWSTDCICLHLVGENGTSVELNEEMARWHTLVATLPSYLPGCHASNAWFSQVAFPAFKTNQTDIFIRADHQTT